MVGLVVDVCGGCQVGTMGWVLWVGVGVLGVVGGCGGFLVSVACGE